MAKFWPTPDVKPNKSVNGLSSVEAGPYLFVGFTGEPGAVYLDSLHVREVARAVGCVTEAQHHELVAELADARRIEAERDRDAEGMRAEIARLEAEVARLSDDLNSANVHIAIREQSIRELAPDPEAHAEQLLKQSIAEDLHRKSLEQETAEQQTAKPPTKRKGRA